MSLVLEFLDFSCLNFEEFEISSLPYRKVSNGINIFGICKKKNCPAYNKEVIVPLEKINTYDLIKEREKMCCPLCQGHILPLTVGFYLCDYQREGNIFEDGIKTMNIEGKSDKEKIIKYYNPNDNMTSLYTKLIIKVSYYIN